MMPPVIVDTNIVVAGLLTSRQQAPVARILDGMLAARFPYVLSEALLAEYRDVLARPKLRKAHGLDQQQREVVLTEIAQYAILLQPLEAHPAPDPRDQHLWELLSVRQDLRLVTGDKLLLDDIPMRPRVLTAEQFVADWR